MRYFWTSRTTSYVSILLKLYSLYWKTRLLFVFYIFIVLAGIPFNSVHAWKLTSRTICLEKSADVGLNSNIYIAELDLVVNTNKTKFLSCFCFPFIPETEIDSFLLHKISMGTTLHNLPGKKVKGTVHTGKKEFTVRTAALTSVRKSMYD